MIMRGAALFSRAFSELNGLVVLNSIELILLTPFFTIIRNIEDSCYKFTLQCSNPGSGQYCYQAYEAVKGCLHGCVDW